MNKRLWRPPFSFEPITPFEPIRTTVYPRGPQWTSQVKWDGVRIVTYKYTDRVQLWNRKRHERTIQYPELVDVSRYCCADSIILDGEVIAFQDGNPSFQHVMKRDSIRKQSRVRAAQSQVPVTYMVFDVLYVNGQWVTNEPLATRQSILTDIIMEQKNVQLVSNHSDAPSLFNAVKKHGLEGIVSKHLQGTYELNGKDARWQKMKVVHDRYAAVGGVTLRNGRVNALLLGLYDRHGHLQYIGHAGTGKLSHNDWRQLTDIATALEQDTCPFVTVPPRSRQAMWIQPQHMMVKVEYAEWTSNDTLRQPSIQAIVPMDRDACMWE